MYKLRIFAVLVCLASTSFGIQTTRIPQFENEKVKVWQTLIYPSAGQALAMHKHERDRVLVALTAGVLKVTNQNGQSHELVLEKDRAYYLPADKAGETHSDENKSGKLIKVMVIEFN